MDQHAMREPRDSDVDAEGDRRILRGLLATPSFRLLSLPERLELNYAAHQRALAFRNIRESWYLVPVALFIVALMALAAGVVHAEAFGVIAFGFIGLAAPVALVVLAHLIPRFQRRASELTAFSALFGLVMMHVFATLTGDLPLHRSIAEHAVIFVTLATCTIANLRFRSAFTVCISALAFLPLFSLVSGLTPNWTLFPFYAVGSLIVGTIVGVTSEIRERTVYLQERLLALEKRELDLLSKELAAISRQDALTGLPNRRHFDEILAREWASCLREQAPLGILFIDVDFFKRFNDLYGHHAGDECLRHVARALGEQALRASDFVARYGGEEFVALFPRTESAGMDSVAERFLGSVDALAIPHAASDAAPFVTVSIGTACLVPDEVTDPQALVQKADAALYLAKASGRHRWVSDSSVTIARAASR
jgi:diguanylate cyclase (GGDEF)-like protein